MNKKNQLLSGLSEKARSCGNEIAQSTSYTPSSDLVFSDVITKELSFFIENKENIRFRKLKSETYFQNLEKDVREAGCFINPLVTMPSGLLIEGESRFQIAKKLFSEGNHSFERIPVRIILSNLSDEDQKRRLILGNLSRFEIDENNRLLLYSEIWADFFSQPTKTAGRPRKSDTVSDSCSYSSEIAHASGISARQLRREKNIYENAVSIAKDEGKEKPDILDIEKARVEINQKRKKDTTDIKPATASSEAEFDSLSYRLLSPLFETLDLLWNSIASPQESHNNQEILLNNHISQLIEKYILIDDIDSKSKEILIRFRQNHPFQDTLNKKDFEQDITIGDLNA
jgi:hypothetical protein